LKTADLLGKAFGDLTVKARQGSVAGHSTWLCLCLCGTEKVVRAKSLLAGQTTSCGCKQNRIDHGHAITRRRSPEYTTWAAILQRCGNSNNSSYPNYGGRGISVCDRWRDSFEAFLSDMGQRPKGCWIERKNNNGNYEPSNCVWATPLEQAKNKRPHKRQP
jgi:hypothetical protein